MAFNNKKSWRYKFIDIDSSYVVKESDDEAIGYIVARAPKGTTRPTYFAKGNSDAIDALIGVGSANWPDLIEAKAFNDEYPIYISAPPGSSDSYPSYLGGFYLTKKGIQKFYNVTNKNELEENSGNAFMAKVVPGKESSYDSTLSNSTIEIGGPLFTDGYVPSSGETGYGPISSNDSNNFKYFIVYIFLYPSTFFTVFLPIVKRKSFNLFIIIAGSSVSSSLKISKSFNNSILVVSLNKSHTSYIGL
jgi:hypothetical protein